ncbi:MAG: hypothetical protein H0T73_01605, partial [Ardenticatenales bacterium]|nr:hypothetical protein [Ardenticatenales bacterium]
TNTPTETPTPLPDIQILGIEVSQGLQNLANQMPLVAGRETRVRVYVRHDATGDALLNMLPTRARLRAYRNGVELIYSPRAAHSIVNVTAYQELKDYRGVLSASFNFYVFPEWHKEPGPITFKVEVNYDKGAAERNYDNNTDTLNVTFNAVTVRPFLYMMPLELYPGGDKNYPPDIYTHEDPDWERISLHLLRYHPLDWFNIWVTSFTLKAGDGTVWKLTSANGRDQVLSALSYWRLHEGKNQINNTQTLVGMVDPNISMDGTGGVYKSGEILVSMNPDTNGQPPWYVQGGVTLAHEVGHAKELSHSGCKPNEEYTDQNYPWSNRCMLAPKDPHGYYGLGLYYWYTNTPDQAQVFSNETETSGPMMSYNEPQWISPYEYCKLLKKYGVPCNLTFGLMARQDDSPSLPNPTTNNAPSQSAELLLVSGVISSTVPGGYFTRVEHLANPTRNARTMAAEQAALRHQQAQQEPSATLVQLNAAGTVLSSHDVLLEPVSDQESTEDGIYFFELVPLEIGVARLQLRLDDVVVTERGVSPTRPTVRLLTPNSGPVGAGTTLTWTGSDADGDALTFALFYSDDNGQRWTLMASDLRGSRYTIPAYDEVPGSTQGRFRVQANDGFHTVTDDSDGMLSAANHAPTVKILNPTGLYLEEGQATSFQAIAMDIEEGQAEPDSLSWSSDLDGPLGSGDLIGPVLSTGVHQLTARATDSGGLSGSDTITVYVGIPLYRLYLPLLNR